MYTVNYSVGYIGNNWCFAQYSRYMCICSQGMSSQGIKAYMNISTVYTSTIVDSCEAYVAALCGGEQRLRGRLVHEGQGG